MKKSPPPGLNTNPKRVQIHPISEKYLKAGHFWITKDSYTEKFPKTSLFLIAKNKKNHDFALLLSDPKHPHIKARLWNILKKPQDPNKVWDYFLKILEQRILSALQKRVESKVSDDRENFYLIFGEGDQLPGLLVQKLGSLVLVQIYAGFWDRLTPYIQDFLGQHLKDLFPEEKLYYLQQKRVSSKSVQIESPKHNFFRKPKEKAFEVQEFGVKYLLQFDQTYDFGLYTDMSSIRNQILPLMKKAKRTLNLFSYTGAYSLFSLANGGEEVYSVDLSPQYMKWYEKNLELNPHLDLGKANNLVMPVEKALGNFAKENKVFDFIICDPPSFSSDGGKSQSALKSYRKLLPYFHQVLEKGGKVLVFLNTHKIKRQKFRSYIQTLNKEMNSPFKLVKEYFLSDDCPVTKGFSEGDYLKGLLLEKK